MNVYGRRLLFRRKKSWWSSVSGGESLFCSNFHFHNFYLLEQSHQMWMYLLGEEAGVKLHCQVHFGLGWIWLGSMVSSKNWFLRISKKKKIRSKKFADWKNLVPKLRPFRCRISTLIMLSINFCHSAPFKKKEKIFRARKLTE